MERDADVKIIIIYEMITTRFCNHHITNERRTFDYIIIILR